MIPYTLNAKTLKICVGVGYREIDVLNFTLLVVCLYVLFVFSHVPSESSVIADCVGLEHTSTS